MNWTSASYLGLGEKPFVVTLCSNLSCAPYLTSFDCNPTQRIDAASFSASSSLLGIASIWMFCFLQDMLFEAKEYSTRINSESPRSSRNLAIIRWHKYCERLYCRGRDSLWAQLGAESTTHARFHSIFPLCEHVVPLSCNAICNALGLYK